MHFNGQEQVLVIMYFHWCKGIQHSNAPIAIKQGVFRMHLQTVIPVISWIFRRQKILIIQHHNFHQIVWIATLLPQDGNRQNSIILFFLLH
jgi:hypothetical protein